MFRFLLQFPMPSFIQLNITGNDQSGVGMDSMAWDMDHGPWIFVLVS